MPEGSPTRRCESPSRRRLCLRHRELSGQPPLRYPLDRGGKNGILGPWQWLPLPPKARCVFRNDVDSLAFEVPPSEFMRWWAVVRVLRSRLDAISYPDFPGLSLRLRALPRFTPALPFPCFRRLSRCAPASMPIHGRAFFLERGRFFLSARERARANVVRTARGSLASGAGQQALRGRDRRPVTFTGNHELREPTIFLTGGKGCRWAKL